MFVYKSQDQVFYILKSYVPFAIPYLLLLQGLWGQNLYIAPVYYVYSESSRAIIWKPCKQKYAVQLFQMHITWLLCKNKIWIRRCLFGVRLNRCLESLNAVQTRHGS